MSEPVPLKGDQGEKLLREVLDGNGILQPCLKAVFVKQIGRKNCGATSCALVLGAKEVGEKHGNVGQTDSITVDPTGLRFTEDKLLKMPQTLSVVTQDAIIKNDGMTLVGVHDLLKAHCADVSIHHASSSLEMLFREDAKAALKSADSSMAIIVNYHMGTLGQGLPFGHHSPLAAYHEQTDRFLILDTWPDTEECWATSMDLFNAMNTIDEASGKSRGYCIAKI